MVVPPVKLSTIGSRAFPVVGPRTWNDLPEDVTSAESLSAFRRRLKTFLFTKSFPGCFLNYPYSGPCSSLHHLGHFTIFLID